MIKQTNQKIKLLFLLNILTEQTNENNRLTTNDLIEQLKTKGISADRKTIYEDIKCLNANGFEVLVERKKRNEYYVVHRPFDVVELRILIDAIQSARFITPSKTKTLIEKISKLTNIHDRKILIENSTSHDTVKSTNEHIFYNTDTIHRSILNKKKVSFLYFDYTIDNKKEYRKDKSRYIVNPIELILSEENYYLICCTDKYKNIISFRIDRMTSVAMEEDSIIDTKCIREFDVDAYKKEIFNMFGGDYHTITLQADKSLTNVIIDKFGQDVFLEKVDDDTFQTEVSVQLSPTFYSWCFMFGNKLKIIAPEDVILLLKKRVSQLQECY